ncbi:hypothetical protein NM65012_2177 [Neisseria meningitidis 65012]|nr:hypothetical protein NM65012_2177 [Neisseria meningitidis 65012]
MICFFIITPLDYKVGKSKPCLERMLHTQFQ